jgi:hypothetical protein
VALEFCDRAVGVGVAIGVAARCSLGLDHPPFRVDRDLTADRACTAAGLVRAAQRSSPEAPVEAPRD